MKQALTIAGSDSGSGAGIQADIKTMMAHGVYATTVITSVTSQNTVEVRGAHELPLSVIRSQLETIFDDFEISAIKTGMLSSAPVVEAVADVLGQRNCPTLLVDPVMVSESGYKLLEDAAIRTLKDKLFPLARLVTPNLFEASLLAGISIQSIGDMHEAAKRILGMGPRAVVVKGGHAEFSRGTDVLAGGGASAELAAPVVFDGNVHGTGCTFSAAVTAHLALGEDITDAVKKAKAYTAQVIARAPEIGKGDNPGNHLFFIEPADFFRV